MTIKSEELETKVLAVFKKSDVALDAPEVAVRLGMVRRGKKPGHYYFVIMNVIRTLEDKKLIKWSSGNKWYGWVAK